MLSIAVLDIICLPSLTYLSSYIGDGLRAVQTNTFSLNLSETIHEEHSWTVRLVAFVNEEAAFFHTENVGSHRYRFPFSFFYPNTGNFIRVVGNMSSRHLLHEPIAIFREYTDFLSEGVPPPESMTGIG
nr:hypothetical protein [Desulfobacterales bacterium]